MKELKVREFYPKTEQGWNELRKRMAKSHIEAVSICVDKLTCPKGQKLALLDAVMNKSEK